MSDVDDWHELMDDASMRLRVLLCFCIALRAELNELEDGGDIALSPFVPGKDHLLAEHVLVVGVDGDIDSDELSGGIDAATDDDITLTVIIRMALEGQSALEALTRADAVYRCVRTVVLGVGEGQDLDDLAQADGLGQVQFTTFGNVVGPYVAANSNGYTGIYRADIRISTNEVSA